MDGVAMNDKIDVIVPWVDGSDPEWIRERDARSLIYGAEKKSLSSIRFQSWDNMRYWFRAIERFMPWINKVFFVTWGHLPEYLNEKSPRLRIVKHEEYIPNEYLPTYNSNTIEMNYHRIEELSENFIIFNDDFFPLQPIDETYYFKDNLVCDEAVEGHITPVETGAISNMARYVQVNNMIIINKHFKKREVQKQNWDKWYNSDYGELLERTKSLNYWYDFAGFRDPHMPSAMKKSVLSYLWQIEGELLDRASMNHFRSYNDVSQYLIRYWQLCSGKFNPRRTLGKFYQVDLSNYEEVARDIEEQKYQMISINEHCSPEEFTIIKSRMNKAFDAILHEKSEFEV
ncbi:MAG: glycosyl transferase [Anaerolineaceae bacterium]|nr:MAG: glycosyl transferase [Anaerolineaceae bacterium]